MLVHDASGCRYGIMNTNISESFNKMLKRARSLPITAIVCLSFEHLSKWFNVRCAIAVRRREASRIFTDKIRQKLNGQQLKFKEHCVIKYNNKSDLHEIRLRRMYYSPDESDYTQIIDLEARTYTCRKGSYCIIRAPTCLLFVPART